MPYIHIRLSTTLDNRQQKQLHKRTTTLMNTVMGKSPEVTVVHIEPSDPSLWSTNGLALSGNDAVAAYVDIKVTRGTNTTGERADMIAKTVAMLQQTVGVIQEACYVVIDDIPADSWGYYGITQAERAARRKR